MSEHSKLPFESKVYSLRMGENSAYNIMSTNRLTVCGNCRQSDAEFMVEACNSYETLKQENNKLKEVLKELHFDFIQPIRYTGKDGLDRIIEDSIKYSKKIYELIKD